MGGTGREEMQSVTCQMLYALSETLCLLTMTYTLEICIFFSTSLSQLTDIYVEIVLPQRRDVRRESKIVKIQLLLESGGTERI